MSMRWLMVSSSRRKRHLRSLLLVGIAAMLMFTSGCALLPDETVEEELPIITPPRLSQKPEYAVVTDTIETKVRGVGKMMSLNEEEVFFTQDNMRIKEIYVKVGDYVREGDVIAELDVTDLENQLRTARLQTRSEELKMIEILRKADELSAEELEHAKIEFELKRTNLIELEQNIARSKLVAPISGNIVSVTMNKGDMSRSYEGVAAIADLSKLTVAVNMSNDDVKKISVGMEAEVDISGGGIHTGTIERLPIERAEQPRDPWNPRPQPKDVIENYVVISVDPLPSGLNRGTPVSASVVVDRKEDVVVIPPATLRTHMGRTYVQVVDEDGNRREVDVEVGQQTPTLVEIVKGLEPGQKVVGR